MGLNLQYTAYMVSYQILYWKHLPSQVKVFEEGKLAVSRQLPERFQAEITRTAMALGLAGTGRAVQAACYYFSRCKGDVRLPRRHSFGVGYGRGGAD